MKPELKPCPFCGESNNLFVQHCEGTIVHPAYRVCCDNCGASTGYVDKANHVDNWNRRVPAETAKVSSDDFARVLKLALEYWADRQQRYKNRAPVWVQEARSLLAHFDQPVMPAVNAKPVGEAFTTEPLDGSEDAKSHSLLTKQLPAGTKLYTVSLQRSGITASEAVYGFAGWLTTRNQAVTFGSTHDCAPIAELVDQFVRRQGLTPPRENYADLLRVFPPEPEGNQISPTTCIKCGAQGQE